MVYVDADGMPEQRVRTAAGIADKFSAVLIGMSAFGIAPPVVANGMVIDAPTDADLELIRAKLAQNRDWFHNIAAAAHRKLEWRSALHIPSEALVRQARCADLVVIGETKPPTGSVYSSLDVGGTILQMGRPTLVVPQEIASLNAEHVVIGWKDTREARRAVQDALPFLHLAAHVTIVEACREDEDKSALARLNDAVLYLQRHRIKCTPKVIVGQQGSGAAQLLKVAQREGADLLVTGAYGHNRLGEWIFGGMTRDLLTNSPVCCLMSH